MDKKFKNILRIITALVLIFVSTGFFGCANGTTDTTFLIYYTNDGADDVIYKETVINRQDMTDFELAQTLMDEMFYSDVLEDEKYYSVKLADLEILDFEITEDNIISINFNDKYNDMSNVQEIIFRSAAVLTLIQIDGIAGVEFFVDGSSITDESGRRIGVMNAEQFVNILLNDEGMLKQDTSLTIYFADESGRFLKPATLIFTIDNKNLSLEEYIVQAIIDGPSEDGYIETVDSNVEILNVFTTDGICYVNLTGTFLSQNQTVDDDIMIYSIVDSLCALSYVDAVQFLVEGESAVTLHMSYNLSSPIERNMALIK